MTPAAFGLSALGFAEEVVESLWTLQLVVQWVGPAGPSPTSPCPHTHTRAHAGQGTSAM